MIKGVVSNYKAILGSISLDLSELSDFINKFDVPILIMLVVLAFIIFIVFIILIYTIIFITRELSITIINIVNSICNIFINASNNKTKRFVETKKNLEVLDSIQEAAEIEKKINKTDNLLGPSLNQIPLLLSFIAHPLRSIKKLIDQKDDNIQEKDDI